MNVGICDDEKYIHQEIGRLLENFFHTYNITYQVYSFFSESEILNSSQELDLLILDIEMDNGNGIQVKNFFEYSHKRTAILFLTNYVDYMPKAFGANVYGFLIKPVEKQQLFSYLIKIVSFTNWQKNIELQSGHWINSRDILYIKSNHNYSYVITIDKSAHIIIKSLNKWENELRSYGFFRIDHSYLINMEHIDCIINDTLVQIGDTKLKISRRRRKEFLTAYQNYSFFNAR
ncbi:Sensory transduction protein LytR [Clostridiales bacterium CHKCI001]|nr:Sensory transduction protein LytR [Clostridiales bacterium CHKCI001]